MEAQLKIIPQQPLMVESIDMEQPLTPINQVLYVEIDQQTHMKEVQIVNFNKTNIKSVGFCYQVIGKYIY